MQLKGAKKHLKQLQVRPFILMRLLSMLIDSKHEVFDGKESAARLHARMASIVAKEYPETEGHLPESNREGVIPDSILELLDAHHGGKQSVLSTKNATPGPGTYAVDKFLEETRPTAVVLDRGTKSVSDPATRKSTVLPRHGDLHVRHAQNPICQWHGNILVAITHVL